MKILILSLCCNIHKPFKILYETQRRTWDTDEVLNIKTIFYEGGSNAGYYLSNDMKLLKLPAPEDGKHLGLKLRLALDFAWDWSWDFVLRSNNSSYVDKKLVENIASTLPTQNCYAGSVGPLINNQYISHVNGGGIWLSRDTADLLRKELSNEDPNEAEDTNIGRFFHARGIKTFEVARGKMPCITMKNFYLYRCRNYDEDPSRRMDSDLIEKVHLYKKSL